MEPLLPSQTLTLVIVAILFLALGAIGGWWAARLHRWWNRDEAEVDEDFARLYSEGITHYIAGRRDDAIQELTQAARLRTDVVGLYLILGDLYREKGLFDRAIRVHAGLLGRQELTRSERAQAYAGLGGDYKTAGMVDRARENFGKALELDPRNLQALKAVSRFSIEERLWDIAIEMEERILRIDRTRKNRPLAFIYNEIGREHLRQGNDRLALRNFQRAIAVDDRVYPAHIFLGDIYYKEGKLKKAVEHWERVVDLEPRHLHLVFDRLENTYRELEMGETIRDLCRRVAERDAADWRVRVLLARLDIGRSDYQAAYRSLLEAARIHPQSLTVQQELWKLMLENRVDRRNIQEYLNLSRGVNEFADPFICSMCRYRSMEYVWRCPQCFEWDTFTEERSAWQ